MLYLSKNLQDHCRSFLSFKEIHTSRLVCKQWVDIDQIPKVLKAGAKVIPFWASFSRITKLKIMSTNETTKTLLHVVLGRNQKHLRSLHFKADLKSPSNLFFPELDALEEFYPSSQESLTYAIIRKSPNIRRLCSYKADFDIDVSLSPKLEELMVASDYVKIK